MLGSTKLLSAHDYEHYKDPVCGNCMAYLTRVAANAAAKHYGLIPAGKRKAFFGPGEELICTYTDTHMNPALSASGCGFYKRR